MKLGQVLSIQMYSSVWIFHHPQPLWTSPKITKPTSIFYANTELILSVCHFEEFKFEMCVTCIKKQPLLPLNRCTRDIWTVPNMNLFTPGSIFVRILTPLNHTKKHFCLWGVGILPYRVFPWSSGAGNF